jgi:hypothetical protein
MTITLYPTSQILVPDGVIASFTLNNIPAANSLLVSRNGLILHPAIDYTISGQIITFVIVPSIGDNVLAFYTGAINFPAPPVRTPFSESEGTQPARSWVQWMQTITNALSSKT